MSNCRNPELQLACFTPTDGSLSKETIVFVTVYDENGSPTATYYQDVNGLAIDITTYLGGGEAKLGMCNVKQATGAFMCLPVDTAGENSFTYENADNSTDITFSNNENTIKWEIDLGQEADADSTGTFISDCINSGNVSSMVITDADGNVFLFDADTVQSDGSATGGWVFTGTAQSGTGSGKVRSVVINCTDPNASSSNKACKIYCPDTNTFMWQLADGTVLTDEQVEELEDCNKECPVDAIQFIKCAAETGATVDSTPVNIGDSILTVARQDCEGIILDSKSYLLSNQEEITDVILTEDCDPSPDVETVRECIRDENGNEWVQISVIDPSDPANNETLYYDNDFNLGTPEGNSDNWTSCTDYVAYDDVKLCEIDAEFLLLIDSGGQFARYSFITEDWTPVNTLSVPSSGGSADVENFRLYNFVSPDQLTVVDVNTDIQLPNVTITDGIINPLVATNPKSFSAGAFRNVNGRLYAWDTAGTDAGLYSIDVTTGVVDFVTSISGVSGTGTSILIDNQSDKLYISGTDFIYEVDWTTGVATLWGDPPIRPNGATFDETGNAYVAEGLDTYYLPSGSNPLDDTAWIQLIGDYGPGANSLAYYRIEAASPSCFFRRFGVLQDGSRELIGDFNISDDSERTIVGDVDCCECGCGNSSSDSGSGNSVETHVPNITSISGTATASGIPATVESITLRVETGRVTVNGVSIGTGSVSWGNGDTNYINASGLSFVGETAGTYATIHWEEV